MKTLSTILLVILLASCNKSIEKPKPTYVWVEVVKTTVRRYSADEFHIITYSDSSFQTQVTLPNSIYAQINVDGTVSTYVLKSADTKILASVSAKITQIDYSDKSVVFNY